MINRRKFFILVGLFITGCLQQPRETSFAYFEKGIVSGTVEGKKLQEASGLAASRNNPGLLWTLNDSGNGAKIFLIDSTGRIKCEVNFPNLKNRDWEDIAVGPGPEGNKSYLYIGDIGDNHAAYDHKFIYRVEEPVIPMERKDTTLVVVDKVKFKLSDGARDTESLMIDPQTKDLYLFSKREAKVNLYKLAYPLSTTETMIAERVLEKLPFTLIVAASISKDGTEILAKNYDRIFYWKREKGQSIETVLAEPAEVLPYDPEPQGESITFDERQAGYYTLSEQKKQAQHLLFYKRKGM